MCACSTLNAGNLEAATGAANAGTSHELPVLSTAELYGPPAAHRL